MLSHENDVHECTKQNTLLTLATPVYAKVLLEGFTQDQSNAELDTRAGTATENKISSSIALPSHLGSGLAPGGKGFGIASRHN